MNNVLPFSKTILNELEQILLHIPVEQSKQFVEIILRAKRLFIAGAGRSGFAGRAFAMRLMHLGFSAYVVGETVTPSIQKQDLLIIISGSGETGSLLSMAKKACLIGAEVALVSICPQSSIGKMTNVIVHIPAPTPKVKVEHKTVSIQPMGALFEQSAFLFLDAVILKLMEERGENSDHMFIRHANLE